MPTAAELQRRRAELARERRRRRAGVAALLALAGAALAVVAVVLVGGSSPPVPPRPARGGPTVPRSTTPTARATATATTATATTATATTATATTAATTSQPVASAMPGAHLAPHEAVPILMFHVIGHVQPGTPSPSLWVSPARFRAHVRALRDGGFHGVTLRQVWDAWHHHAKLPSKPVVFSFDDGYEGQVRDALPALRQAGWPGVLNLTLKNLPDIGGTRGAKRLIAAGWEIDSHTLTHPDLTTLPDAALRRELRQSRARITRLFGQPASFFCYPSGRYDARVIAAVRAAGYRAATTVAAGYARPAADPFALARVRVDGATAAAQLMQRLRDLRPAA